jgi:Transcriptional regulatory protein, C terminal
MDEEAFTFGSFRLIPAQRMLSEDGNPVHLGSRALDILAALTEHAGETVTKEQLIARAWPDMVVDEGALTGPCCRAAQGVARRPRLHRCGYTYRSSSNVVSGLSVPCRSLRPVSISVRRSSEDCTSPLRLR